MHICRWGWYPDSASPLRGMPRFRRRKKKKKLPPPIMFSKWSLRVMKHERLGIKMRIAEYMQHTTRVRLWQETDDHYLLAGDYYKQGCFLQNTILGNILFLDVCQIQSHINSKQWILLTTQGCEQQPDINMHRPFGWLMNVLKWDTNQLLLYYLNMDLWLRTICSIVDCSIRILESICMSTESHVTRNWLIGF